MGRNLSELLTPNEEESYANQVNKSNKINEVCKLFELMLALRNDFGYQMCELSKIGMTADNSSKHFSYVAEFQFLLTKALEPMTKLYDAVLEEASK